MRVAQGIYTTTLQVGKEEGWSAADTDLAFQIAVSTAQKESTLGADPRSRRPDGNGDGGIFAQRTKPGWYGTIDQVNDPAYGTRIFLLGKKVTAADVAAARQRRQPTRRPGRLHHPRTEAGDRLAAAVDQRGLPPHPTLRLPADAGPVREDRPRPAAGLRQGRSHRHRRRRRPGPGHRRLSGRRPGRRWGSGLNCPATSMPAEQYQLTPDALAVTRCVAQQFPQITTIGTYTGHDPDLTRAVDIMIPSYASATGKALGVKVRDWVQQHAAPLGVDYLIWNEQIWSTKRAGEGWRQCGTAAPPGCYSGPDDSASHRNHVHVSVFGSNSVEYAKTHGGEGTGAGTGACSLDDGYAPGRKNPNSCDEALAFLQRQDATNSGQWYRSCLALVANAYGWGYSGVATAGQHALLLKRAGKLNTSRTNIPRGAVVWWTNSGAGHVAVYAGDGQIYSNDAVTPGQVSKVAWDLPEKQWGQHFEGWSAPYFPHAGGSVS